MRAGSQLRLFINVALWGFVAWSVVHGAQKLIASRIEWEQTISQHRFSTDPNLLTAFVLAKNERELTRAIRFDRAHYHLYLLRGNVYFLQRRFDLAIEDYLQALKRRKDPPTLLNLAEAYRASQRMSEARACIEQALAFDRNNLAAQTAARNALERLVKATPSTR